MNVALMQITAPSIARRYVQRPRLSRLAHSHSKTKLIFVGAPPGYGKSSFASSFANTESARGNKCAWVSMERQDNDPMRFWTLVVSALEKSDHALSFSDALSAAESPYDVIASLANQIMKRQRVTYSLVIDNYHYATSEEINDQVGSLLANAPDNLTLMLVSDSAPTLPVSVLRIEGGLIEIYADDLRFRLEETDYYLHENCAVALGPKEIKNIHHATRGWPAGLSMAIIALNSGKTGPEVLMAIDEMRSAFFMDAVVSRKSDEMRQFLLRISHLPRVSPILAEYVSGMGEAGALLAELEHDELFSEISNESPPWYAFSKTFREALHQYALKTMAPAVIRSLHQRAGEWFESNGDYMLAIDFSLKAQRPEHAAEIMVEHGEAVLAQAQGDALVSHIGKIRFGDQVSSRVIGAMQAWANCVAGLPRQALHWISLARSAEPDEGDRYGLLLDLAEARANSLIADFGLAVEQAEAVLARIDAQGVAVSSPWMYVTARHALGESYMHLGEFQKAIDHLSYCVDMAVPAGRSVLHYLAACELSELHALFGRWNEAELLARAALRAQRSKLTEAPWSLALVQIQLASLLLQSGRIDDAEDMAMRARRRLTNQANDDGWLCLTFLEAQLCMAHGDRLQASRLFKDTLHFAQTHSIPRGKAPLICAQSVIHLLAIDDYPLAMASMADVLENGDANDPYACALVELACATFSLFNGLPEDAQERSERVYELSEEQGFVTLSATALIVRAFALSALKDVRNAALSLLDAASRLEPCGISFPFVSAGSRIGALIEQTLGYCSGASHAFQREKAAEVAFLRSCAASMSAGEEPDRTSADLGLTQREQQVYHLLQLGKSRREIANELGISYNTVRVHVSNIYKKTQMGDEAG